MATSLSLLCLLSISLIFFLFFGSCLSNDVCDLVLGWVLWWFWCLWWWVPKHWLKEVVSLDLSLGVECGTDVLWRILWSKATEVGPHDFPSNPQASWPFSKEAQSIALGS